MRESLNFNSGFTLIELIITATIILIMTAIGVASYNNFNETQTLRETAKNLENNIRLAQGKAVAVEKICGQEGCGGEDDGVCDNDIGELPLSFWEIKFYTYSYEIYGVCQDKTFNKKTYYLSTDNKISFFPVPQPLQFIPLSGQTTNKGDICLNGFNKKYKISISSQGEINDYGIVSVCP